MASFLNQPRPVTHPLGSLFIISAPSGTGKTTLCKQLIATVPSVWYSVSCTTRDPRPEEVEGREYFFIKDPAFQKMIREENFLEWAQVYGHSYGTPKNVLKEKLSQGVDVLLEIDVQGALQIKKQFANAVMIFIVPPSRVALQTRLQTRGSNSDEEIRQRLAKVDEEVSSYWAYTYIIRNDDVKRSLRELKSIFVSERLKIQRQNLAWFEKEFLVNCAIDGHTPIIPPYPKGVSDP